MIDLLSSASGLFGETARKLITDNSLESFEITSVQQLKLFEISYGKESSETKRLCTKPDVQRAYGQCHWDKLNQGIKEIVIDLKCRGDYTPLVRKKIQRLVSGNDIKKFFEVINNRANWPTVPVDRFHRRIEFYRKLNNL